MPICIAALLVPRVRPVGPDGEPMAIGDVSRLIGGGPGGGGGILLDPNRCVAPREPDLGEAIGLEGAAISGEGYEVCWSPDGA